MKLSDWKVKGNRGMRMKSPTMERGSALAVCVCVTRIWQSRLEGRARRGAGPADMVPDCFPLVTKRHISELQVVFVLQMWFCRRLPTADSSHTDSGLVALARRRIPPGAPLQTFGLLDGEFCEQGCSWVWEAVWVILSFPGSQQPELLVTPFPLFWAQPSSGGRSASPVAPCGGSMLHLHFRHYWSKT